MYLHRRWRQQKRSLRNRSALPQVCSSERNRHRQDLRRGHLGCGGTGSGQGAATGTIHGADGHPVSWNITQVNEKENMQAAFSMCLA